MLQKLTPALRALVGAADKSKGTPFTDFAGQAALRVLGVDTVIIAGVSTSGCIRATAVDGPQHGFVPLVVRQAVGDRTAWPCWPTIRACGLPAIAGHRAPVIVSR